MQARLASFSFWFARRATFGLDKPVVRGRLAELSGRVGVWSVFPTLLIVFYVLVCAYLRLDTFVD